MISPADAVPGTCTVCQGGGDLAGQRAGTAHARGGLEHDLRDLLGAGLGQLGRGAEGLQQGQDGRVPQAASEDAFEGGVDGGEQSAQPVGGAGGVLGEVVVVAQDHGQFGPHALVGLDGVQQVGQGAGGVGDDVGIAGVGLAGAGVQIGQPAHRQAWQVGDFASTVAGDGDRQGADGGRCSTTLKMPTWAVS